MLVSVVLIPSSIALGAGQYLAVIWPGQNPNLVGAAIMLAVGGLAVLEIKTNAIVQGILLAIELIAVGTIVVLGLVHINQPVSVLFSPVTYGADGNEMAVAFGTVMTAGAIAIFAYNGYGSAVCFAEETKRSEAQHRSRRALDAGAHGGPRARARHGGDPGSPLARGPAHRPTPMSYILTSLGGEAVNTVVSLLVFIAIFNGCLAIVVTMCRIIYGSGRDRTWPEPISGWLAKVHPKYKSPWVAALTMAVFGAVLTATSDVAVVVTWTGIVLVFTYALIALSAIVVRLQKQRPARALQDAALAALASHRPRWRGLRADAAEPPRRAAGAGDRPRLADLLLRVHPPRAGTRAGCCSKRPSKPARRAPEAAAADPALAVEPADI